ncbi:prolyl 4-hydroxylase subunit alpha-1-like [Petromyzon marinus]|uniref:prolyl 4-hydroxylase subunit alpha-1-like n=1 Tax=Petromyzon marinus TaxID=7757 RepID=UPI003F6F7A74
MLRLLLLVLVVRPALTEVFTSIGHMSELLDTEADLLLSLDSYIAVQQRRLHSLRAWAESIQEVRRSATLDPEGFLGNPVNAYRLLKRLGQQWRALDDSAIMNPATEFLANVSAQRLRLPTEEDVTGAAKALMRLQDTYRLRTRDIADGNLPGAKFHDALSARDCYDLGRVAYTEGDYRHTQLWMRQALRMVRGTTWQKRRGAAGGGERRGAEDGEVEETPGGGSAVEGVEWLTGSAAVDEVDVLDHLSFVAFQQGETEEAYALTKQLLALDPSHERAQGNLDYFSRALSSKRKGDDESQLLTTGIRSDSSSSSSPSSKRRRKDTMGGERLGDDEEEEEEAVEEEVGEEVDDGRSASYMKLCRGEGIKMTSRRRARLSCRLWDGRRNPRLLLRPLRLEEEWDRPLIVRYHGVVSDQEIHLIKELAKPRLQRATVHDPQTGELTVAHYRVSKSAWLRSEHHPLVQRLNERVADITGLNMDTAEELQVANYGMGGQYDPHFDFGRKEEPDAFKELGTGNRMATFLIYMSDVPAGGATVFPDVGAAIWPIKGTAVFWFNLLASGEGDYSTRHAACPVLVGSKWVSNKWIHERGQEFKRPCSLNQTE